MNIYSHEKGMSKDLDGHILNIVQNFEIKEQNELQHHLIRKGYNIPQATLSRRLKKLNIAKVSGKYEIVNYHHSHIPIVLSIKISEFGLIILHTHPGNASSLAYYLDKKYISYSPKEQNAPIIGTIAGDDTVLLIIKSKSAIQGAIKLLQDDFPYLSGNEDY